MVGAVVNVATLGAEQLHGCQRRVIRQTHLKRQEKERQRQREHGEMQQVREEELQSGAPVGRCTYRKDALTVAARARTFAKDFFLVFPMLQDNDRRYRCCQ
jgi:hypothetical protein